MNQSGNMETSLSNASFSSSQTQQCIYGPHQIVILSLVDIFTFLIGEPVAGKLLWISFTAKKTLDILNCNLAFFHCVHYFMAFIHLIFLFLLPQHQAQLLNILYMYAQTGGSVSLVFICMERYIAVIYPTNYHLLKKYRFRETCALIVWLLTAITVSIANHLTNVTPLTGGVLKAIPRFVLGATCSMMFYYNVSILRALKKSAPEKDELHPAKKRAFITIRATTLINLSCYIPANTLQIVMYLKNPSYECLILPVCITLLSAASLVHPLFYLSTQGKLRVCSKGEKKVG